MRADPLALMLHRTVTEGLGETFKTFRGPDRYGTHFTVDRAGQIIQVASLDQFTMHVGNMRARCREEGTCAAAELRAINAMGWAPSGISNRERSQKSYPDRYPTSYESVGIEVIASYDPVAARWQRVTPEQLESVHVLVRLLQATYGLDDVDVYRHDIVSYKTPGEGAGLGF